MLWCKSWLCLLWIAGSASGLPGWSASRGHARVLRRTRNSCLATGCNHGWWSAHVPEGSQVSCLFNRFRDVSFHWLGQIDLCDAGINFHWAWKLLPIWGFSYTLKSCYLDKWCSHLFMFILHSFIPGISIAPLKVLYFSEVLPTTALILCRS